MTAERELLLRYAHHHDEAAFADLVKRHADLVYSIARRVTNDATLAEDVTQVVFTELARRAGALCGHPTLVGWLHTTTRHTAINLIRGEARRRIREQEAVTMHHDQTAPASNWAEIAPLLDEAVDNLNDCDRQAVLLRFFNGLSHQEVGAILGLSENSANKRIERALEKLRAHFTRCGVTASSTLLASVITANSVQAAPVGLAERTTQTSLAGAGVVANDIFLKILLMNTKNKILLVMAILLSAVAIWLFRLPALSETVAKPSMVAIVTKPAPLVSAPKAAEASVVPPMLQPGTVLVSSTQSTTTLPTDPHAASITELNATLDDIANYFRMGDWQGAYLALSPPDQVDLDWADKLKKPQDLALIANNPAALRQEQAGNEAIAKVFEDFKNQVPTFNANGDEATYEYEDINGNSPLIFIKINGKWHRKDGGGKNGLRP